MRYIIPLLFLFCLPLFSFGQNAQLAQQYYRDGEFEKAAIVYKKLYDAQNRNDYYFDKYVECLIAVEDYKGAENALQAELKKKPEEHPHVCAVRQSVRAAVQ